MTAPRLLEVRCIRGALVVETGLRIGANVETLEISGLDNPIIRNPTNGEPYIPGSSLKGKMRSLAEWYFAEIPEGGEVIRPRVTARTGQVFGLPARQPKANDDPAVQAAHTRGPTRLIVRDAHLAAQSRAEFSQGRPLTEIKSENSINRLSSMANPRPMERVLPGVEFEIELLFRVFDVEGDGGQTDRQNFDEVVLRALALVQADALGGAGSRGCGKVRFDRLTLDGQPLALPPLAFASQVA